MTTLNFSRNCLSESNNPYLRQHQANPIHWQEWSPELLEKARKERRPLFISIGYATCHWCHVMAKESFSDQQVADLLNENFISVKVDREQFPEVDTFYLNAASMMGIQGGWPLTVFCDYQAKPFFVGTYYPLVKAPGYRSRMLTFPELVKSIIHFWQNDNDKIITSSEQVYQGLKNYFSGGSQKEGSLKDRLSVTATGKGDSKGDKKYPLQEMMEVYAEDKEFFEIHQKYFDSTDGGFRFQTGNKFPCTLNLLHFLKIYRKEKQVDVKETIREMIFLTVDKMLAGGIYDQIGGGLCRYSTDYQWQVPHFEKMLYDNALFLELLVEMEVLTGAYRTKIDEIVAYYRREMMRNELFFSAEDADSEGKEGTFYLWDMEDSKNLLQNYFSRNFSRNSPDQQESCWQVDACLEYWGMTSNGDLRGLNVPRQETTFEKLAETYQVTVDQVSSAVEEGMKVLFTTREERIKPFKDDKVVTAWNGYMIKALAKAGRMLDAPSLLDQARKSLHFFYQKFKSTKTQDKLSRNYHYVDGSGWTASNSPAQLSDYAALILAALEIHLSETLRLDELNEESIWLDWAQELLNLVFEKFGKKDVFSEISHDHRFLLEEMIHANDGVEPSGNSMITLILHRINYYLPQLDFKKQVEQIFDYFYDDLSGTSLPTMLSALHLYKTGLVEVKVTSPDSHRLRSLIKELKINKIVDLYFRGNVVETTTEDRIEVCHQKTCEVFSDPARAREKIESFMGK